MISTHVCMVSAQAAPNLLPLLDDQMKPKEVILLVTEQMKGRADHLRDVIKPTGVKVTVQPFLATGEFHSMQIQLETLISSYPEGSIALNVTGGNKWMAITAQEVFRFNNQPVFYVDIETDRILFVDSQREPVALTARIKLKQYLQAYGYDVIGEQTSPSGLTDDQRNLCHYLVNFVDEWGGAIGQLNYLASEAERKSTLSISLTLLKTPDREFESLLKQCQGAGILSVDQSRKQIAFADKQARFFANGGWLEEYVNSRLNELKSEGLLQDSSHLNMKISSPNATNEVDVAFMAGNRLHIIECKTRRLTGPNAGSAGTESLYKLDSISELGGLATRSMLVSYRPLGSADKQRATDLRIKVVEGLELRNIKSIMKAWIRGK